MRPLTYEETAPGTSLAGFVEAVWTLSSGGAEPPERAGTILPDGAIEIVLSWNGSVGTAVPGSRVHGLVVGQMDGPATVRYDGPVDITGVRLRAAAAASFLGRSPAAFAGRIVALEEGAPALVPLVAGGDR